MLRNTKAVASHYFHLLQLCKVVHKSKKCKNLGIPFFLYSKYAKKQRNLKDLWDGTDCLKKNISLWL